MPEGDTLYRMARTLHRALAGKQITAFDTAYAHLANVNDNAPLVGRTVERIVSQGKWLLMYFTGDLILATHMLMKGSWHIYRPGERWQRGSSQMRIRLDVQDVVAVAFNVQTAHFYTEATLIRNSAIPKLGPDLLQNDFSLAEAKRRVREHPGEEIANTLLRQKVVAGIGNVYKSEVCFLCKVSPFRLVKDVSEEELTCLLERAQQLLKANVNEKIVGEKENITGQRRTVSSLDPDRRLWVYERVGKPCRRCGETIQLRKQGTDARLTFWCPECQQ